MDIVTKSENDFRTYYDDVSDDDGAPADDEDSLDEEDWVEECESNFSGRTNACSYLSTSSSTSSAFVADDFFGTRPPKSNLDELEFQTKDDGAGGDDSDGNGASGNEEGGDGSGSEDEVCFDYTRGSNVASCI